MNDPEYIESVNTTTLMIVNVTVTDWGVYSCEAGNIVNNATSNEAILHSMCVCFVYSIAMYVYVLRCIIYGMW